MQEVNYDKYFWQQDGIRLRAVREEDWEDDFHNRFDSEARRLALQCGVELPVDADAVKKFVEKSKEFASAPGWLVFTIETLDGKHVGDCDMKAIDERNGTFSIGMQIDRDQRGKGYGTAAMHILLRYAFLERRLNKLWISIMEGNVASAVMSEKVGCVKEGVRPQMFYTDGKYFDELLYGLTKKQYCDKIGIKAE